MSYCIRALRKQMWGEGEAEEDQGSKSPGEGGGWSGPERVLQRLMGDGVGCGGGL